MQYDLDERHVPPRPHRSTANRRLQKALDERERFLKRHPHLRPYQAEIERILDNSGGTMGRMAVLGTLMQGKLLELQGEFVKLNRYLH
ncbi:MAG TPA: hypothetical protein VLT88_15630 [Desulfosarcina sp.]|nr:hypothetical protein [Desulfosarcina sp.]